MRKRLKEVLSKTDKKLLSIYYTMGYPRIDKVEDIFQALEQSRQVDFVELGMPYSDPLADGPTIQKTSTVAIENGVTMEVYFEMARKINARYTLPLVYMGYLNPIYQVGPERFCQLCQQAGIEGVIIPDLPFDIYERDFKALFEKYHILVSFLITPTTSDDRIRKIEELTSGFIYVVSSSSITGKKGVLSPQQKEYFERIRSFDLKKPSLVGFGIHDKESYEFACQYADGAIIGSAFLRILEEEDMEQAITSYIHSIKP